MHTSTCNVFILGIAFLFIFTAFNTASMIQKTVVDSINRELDVQWNGFYGLCVLYATFSVSNFLAPSILNLLGIRCCLFVGACTYLLYICVFLHPVRHVLNIVSVFIGVGASVLWTSQGSFLTRNSTKNTMDRNTGIFWALFQGSLLFGNIFVYFQFRGVDQISESTRLFTYSVFACVCGSGCLMLLALRPLSTSGQLSSHTPHQSDAEVVVPQASTTELNPASDHLSVGKQVHQCFKLLNTAQMRLLLPVFFYSGLILSFYSGVYVTAVGSTTGFGHDSSKLIGLCGMAIGLGEIIGGGLFGMLGKRFNLNGRSPIIVFGIVLHLAAFYLTYLNLPDNSSIGRTDHIAYLQPSVSIALACAFAYGFGDACLNTQIYSIIGSLFPASSNLTSSAFALFKFTQSISAAISFFYSQVGLRLTHHLLILVSSGLLSTFSFMFLEFRFIPQ